MMRYKVYAVFQVNKTVFVPFSTDLITRKELYPFLKEIEKNQKIVEVHIEDEMDQRWHVKEFYKLQEKTITLPQNPVIYFDGGFDYDTNTTSIGVVIYYEQNNRSYRLKANTILDRFTSNKEAEYIALFQACNYLTELNIKQTVCLIKGDAQGVLKQLQGEWPCYDEQLNMWLDRIEEKIKDLQLKVNIEVIGRKENKEADRLATQALKGVNVYSHDEIKKSEKKGLHDEA